MGTGVIDAHLAGTVVYLFDKKNNKNEQRLSYYYLSTRQGNKYAGVPVY